MAHTITLIPGDNLGPEMSEAVRRIIAAANVNIDWDVQICGLSTWEREGTSLPNRVIDSITKNGIALKSPLATPPNSNEENTTALLRKKLDLYCNIRPMKNIWEIPCKYKDLDIVIIREATEDVYAGFEHEVVPNVVETLKVTTQKGCERIASAAFEYANQWGRKKITTVHKANIMKKAEGLFLEVSRQIAKKYPDIQHSDIIVDNCAMQLVSKPSQFDVLLLGNLFGDIISDLCAGLIGGISLIPSINISESGIRIYESPHGGNPNLSGKNYANPLPLLTPALYMLRYIGEDNAADRILKATKKTLFEQISTPDLGGTSTTSYFVEKIISNMLNNA